MDPHLARCRTLIEDATAGLDEETARQRPEGRWSIAEILEHLDRTYTGTTKGFERAVQSGERRLSPATLRSRLRKFAVVTMGLFPTGIAAPRHVLPSGEPGLVEVLARTATHLAEMDAAATRLVARFGRGPVLDHPILGPFTTADWMRFHQVHTRHHCRQVLARRAATMRP